MKMTALADDIGKGLFAGFAGTLAITTSQTIEMKIRGRAPSDSPAEAAGKVLGVQPSGEEEKKRFSQIVHFGYGTAWGAVRGILAAAGVPPPIATALHFAAIFGTAMVMLPALKVAPPVSEWGAESIAIDSLHHLVYALATGAAYDRLAAGEAQ